MMELIRCLIQFLKRLFGSKPAIRYHHPKSEAEIVALVRKARAEKKQVRVRGSLHSFPNALIHTDNPGSPNEINIMLDRYRKVEWVDKAKGIVRVQAGCNLGPYDGTCRFKDSFLGQIDAAGFALDTLGGITHQTVSGFLSTGSSGGTLSYNIGGNIVALRFIDGTGTVRDVTPASDPDLFGAVGVSMGLLGILSTVTFRCVEKFAIEGDEATSSYDDCAIDVFGPGDATRPSLEQWLRKTPYGRIMWWPQRGVERLVVWQASRRSDKPPFQPHPLPQRGELEQLGIAILLTVLDRIMRKASTAAFEEADRKRLLKMIGTFDYPKAELEEMKSLISDHTGRAAADLEADVVDRIFAFLFGIFVKPGKHKFSDYSWRGVPMDNGVLDDVLPIWFSELWFPVELALDVVNRLNAFFQKADLREIGTMSFEIYGSKASPFWMSPSFGRDIVRIDCIWFANNAGDPERFFGQYWDLMKPLGFRPHWGKFVPHGSDWTPYFAKQFPRWNDFLAKRAQLDPDGLFLTKYWRARLGL